MPTRTLSCRALPQGRPTGKASGRPDEQNRVNIVNLSWNGATLASCCRIASSCAELLSYTQISCTVLSG
eukprot:5042335-Pyramimonas_sp.AAC.1